MRHTGLQRKHYFRAIASNGMLTRLRRGALMLAISAFCGASSAGAEPTHGIAMHGAPALSADFAALPYARADAPKGGRIAFGAMGGFDSLNPFILKGRAPWDVRAHTVESLMERN
ncbi:MAG: hypothetical protein CVT86_06580, partial [Alphaproteobacteria bacterium HGW-Alphaproteobacteria-8]